MEKTEESKPNSPPPTPTMNISSWCELSGRCGWRVSHALYPQLHNNHMICCLNTPIWQMDKPRPRDGVPCSIVTQLESSWKYDGGLDSWTPRSMLFHCSYLKMWLKGSLCVTMQPSWCSSEELCHSLQELLFNLLECHNNWMPLETPVTMISSMIKPVQMQDRKSIHILSLSLSCLQTEPRA